jgi:hypothetical protein
MPRVRYVSIATALAAVLTLAGPAVIAVATTPDPPCRVRADIYVHNSDEYKAIFEHPGNTGESISNIPPRGAVCVDDTVSSNDGQVWAHVDHDGGGAVDGWTNSLPLIPRVLTAS